MSSASPAPSGSPSSSPSASPSSSPSPTPSEPNDFQLEQNRLAKTMLDHGVSDHKDLPGEVLDSFDPAVLDAGPAAS
jgi:hypothetical protein